jgi:biopolymer transport protein ExbD
MAIKKKSKVTAEFNMSSLTDIIFLLLIFFMLTSSMVTPNALNLQLPGKKKTSMQTNSMPMTVTIEANRTVYYNGSKTSMRELEKHIRQLRRDKGTDAVISVTAAKKATNDDLVRVLDMAYRYEVKASLNDPK